MTLSSIAALQQAPEPNPNPHLAWVVEWGAISLPLGHPSRLTCLAIHDTEHEAAAALYECDQAGINARMWPISLNVDGQPGYTDEIASRASVRAVVKDTGWMPIETAPKDGTKVLLIFKSQIPRDDSSLNVWAGRQFVGSNHGDSTQWGFAAPVGMGGFPDEWLAGWQPLPPPPKENTHD